MTNKSRLENQDKSFKKHNPNQHPPKSPMAAISPNKGNPPTPTKNGNKLPNKTTQGSFTT